MKNHGLDLANLFVKPVNAAYQIPEDMKKNNYQRCRPSAVTRYKATCPK